MEMPYDLLSDEFFKKRGRMSVTNQKRNERRKSRMSYEDNGIPVSKFPSIASSKVSDSIDQSLNHLGSLLKSSTNAKKRSIVGCKAVLNHIKATSPVSSMKDLVNVYKQAVAHFISKDCSSARMSSVELQERFHDNGIELVSFYMYGEAFTVFPKTESVYQVVRQIQKVIPAEGIVKETLSSKLEDIFKVSLEMLSSKSDQEIVKALFATVTSAKFTAKLQGLY